MKGILQLFSLCILSVVCHNLSVANELSQETCCNNYFVDEANIFSDLAKSSVMKVSSLIYKNTGFKLFVHVLKETPIMTKVTDKNRLLSYQDKFKLRRDYENNFLSGIQGNYAVLFLFYDDHHITLKSNVDFLDTSYLLNEYAYPYLPAVSTSSNEYREGVNTGVSNVYLAIAHEIASHYKMDLNIPQPMQKPSGGVRSIIYIMLFSLISLFLLVYFGFLSKHKE